MPRYDQHCEACGWQAEIVAQPGEHPLCPDCGCRTERLWVAPASVHGDEIPGGVEIENLGPEPMTFYSRSEIAKEAKRRGLEPFVRHVPVPGTDKSPHTTSWAAASPWMLEQAKVLLERVERGPAPSATPEPVGPGDVSAAHVAAIVRARWPSL